MFGSRPQPQRPVLLVLVFGVLLMLVGITATAQAVMVSAYASASTLTSVVESDAATIRGFLNDGFDRTAGAVLDRPDPATLERLEAYVDTLVSKGGIARVELRGPDGRLVVASGGEPGEPTPLDTAFADAIAGSPSVAILDAAESGTAGPDLPQTVVREYLPLRAGDRTALVVGIWRDAGPILSRLDGLRRDVVLVTLSAAVVAAVVLFGVFRSAQARINRQTTALIESTRMDPLTDTLNHGALVAHLASEIERARVDASPLAVVLLDVDNFRLLNDTHGHRAGDAVLVLVANAVRAELASSAVMGRYGPDEFLVLLGHADVVDVEATVNRIRARLTTQELRFQETDALPLSVSAGIAVFPEHGASVTELLSTVAATLQEARVSGGDTVRVAGADRGEHVTGLSGFDVLQGLVFSVDTKDRYTKRHSEDVARYAVFLAERLGLDAQTVSVIHTAGLLHDVGKIGIPDAVLRKPGRLTAEEYEVVKQHVALGDMIVRDLPDIDQVRAGIRHHHERWDGRGYLDALAGEDIPLIARILAVGDAFSAMTTTRPYRKALDVREALVRLSDAAGTQLDEDLVEVFVRGIETAADAPLPGVEVPSLRLWTPRRQVA